MQKIDAIGGTLGSLARISITIAGAVYGCCSKRQQGKAHVKNGTDASDIPARQQPLRGALAVINGIAMQESEILARAEQVKIFLYRQSSEG
jgi:hypothetical protein